MFIRLLGTLLLAALAGGLLGQSAWMLGGTVLWAISLPFCFALGMFIARIDPFGVSEAMRRSYRGY